jgi:hypothetical protein
LGDRWKVKKNWVKIIGMLGLGEPGTVMGKYIVNVVVAILES